MFVKIARAIFELEPTMQHINFFIPGPPTAKGRPRFARMGAFVRAFTPAKTVNAEANIRFFAKKAMDDANLKPFEGALFAIIDVYFHKPPSVSRIYHTARPDVDNILKGVLDAFNGIIFIDDAQIIDLIVRKHYTSESFYNEGIEIEMVELSTKDENKVVKQRKGKK